MNETNCEVYDIIISFVRSYRNTDSEHPYIKSQYNGQDTWIWNCHYLLNQILRHVNIPPERYLVSEKAYEKWSQISTDNINNYYDGSVVKCEFDNVEIKEFKGNGKNYSNRIINKGDTFIFNRVFLLEHMIPISKIIDALVSLPDNQLDYHHVDEILSKRYVCRILKEEDALITRKYNRSLDVDEVLESDYHDIKVIR